MTGSPRKPLRLKPVPIFAEGYQPWNRIVRVWEYGNQQEQAR